MAEKYQIVFNTQQNQECIVRIFIDGYVGDPIQLTGTDRPFILREFNTDEDIFKPIRPQQAEISFYNQSGVSIDDFLGNSDTYAYVGFNFISTSRYYWTGYLLQDDFQEIWQDSKHIITLRASEGIGLLKNVPLSDEDGNELIGNYSIDQLIRYSIYGSSQTFLRYYIINNLYNIGMDDGDHNTSLMQTYIDAKTFSIGDGEYESKYTVLEKINKAFNQTIFQYLGRWYILRVEELFIPSSQNLRQFSIYQLGSPYPVNVNELRYDINIGANEEIKPITPEMIRFIDRPIKITKLNYYYDYPSEIIDNQNFKRGALLSSSSSLKTYSVTNWTAYKGSKSSPTPTTVDHYRKDIIDTYGNVIDSYLWMDSEPMSAENWWQSNNVKVSKNDVFDISFLWRWNETGVLFDPIPTYNIAQVFFTKSTYPYSTYWLNNSGDWTPGTFDSSSNKFISIKPDKSSIDVNKYFEKSVLTKPLPYDGNIKILLTKFVYNYQGIYSQIQIRLQGSINGLTTANIDGNYEKITKDQDIRSNFEEEIYLDDTTNYKFNGALNNSSGVLTNPTWYRYRFSDESYGFKKQNLIAHYEHNNKFRNRIDGTFYGLVYNGDPIGMINTVKFINDDPKKIYYITNLKEIDFANSVWNATLTEIYDEDRDFNLTIPLVIGEHDGNANIPLTFTDTNLFQLISGTNLKYIGTESINVNISCHLTGSLICSVDPTENYLTLETNLQLIDTTTFPIVSSPYSVDTTLSGTNITIAPNEEIFISMSALVTSFNVTGVSLIIDNNLVYPNYIRDFIYK